MSSLPHTRCVHCLQIACIWVLSLMTANPQLVVAQMQRDINILLLVDAMDDVYDFVKEAEPLRTIKSHEKVITVLAQQTIECGYFISAYCKDDFRMSDFPLYLYHCAYLSIPSHSYLEACRVSHRRSHSRIWKQILRSQDCLTSPCHDQHRDCCPACSRCR